MRAAGREENASEAPSHSDTFKEAEVASGKSTLPQWVDNVARCDVSREQDTHRGDTHLYYSQTCTDIERWNVEEKPVLYHQNCLVEGP